MDAVDPTFTLLRSVSALSPDRQASTIRGVLEHRLRGNRAVAYVAAQAETATRPQTRGRPPKKFQVRAPGAVSLPVEKRSFTVQHGDDTLVLERTLVDLRDTNLAAFFRHLERQLGWKMEPTDFIAAVEQALLSDRAALHQFESEE